MRLHASRFAEMSVMDGYLGMQYYGRDPERRRKFVETFSMSSGMYVSGNGRTWEAGEMMHVQGSGHRKTHVKNRFLPIIK